MNSKRILLVVMIVLLTFAVTACKMPASKPPATATVEGGFPVPGQGTETMGIFESIATQTAQAGGGQQQPVLPTTTAVVVITEAPQPTPEKPAAVVPTATPGIPSSYTLQKGEFPYCVARRFNVNPSELLSLNGLNANSVTYAGQKLSIPQTGHKFPGDRSLHDHTAKYTVKSGDTIYTVACYYGDLDPMAIVAANSLESPYTLKSGQSLQIP